MQNTIALCVFNLIFIPAIYVQGQKGPAFRIVDEEGIPVAVNPDHPLPLPDSPKDILFIESFQIGAKDGDPNYIFGEFIGFAVDDEGYVYVLDWREKTVRKFDNRGKYVLSFGGAGQGPGEFSDPKEIRYLPDGNIMVFEAESQKYTSFTKEGEVVRTGRFPKLMLSPYFGLTDGSILAMNVLRDQDKTVYTTGVFDESGKLIKPLNRIERKPDPPWPREKGPDARAKRYAQVFSRAAFRRGPVLTLNEQEDLFFALADRYEIKIHNADGELEKIVRTELPFLPVGKKDRRAFLDKYLPRDIPTWSTMGDVLQNRIISLIEFPDEKPALLDIIPMDEDYLLVVRDGDYGENALIDIFDPSGRFIIEKVLPFPIKNGICKGGRLYTIHEDEMGHQFVKCYVYRFKH